MVDGPRVVSDVRIEYSDRGDRRRGVRHDRRDASPICVARHKVVLARQWRRMRFRVVTTVFAVLALTFGGVGCGSGTSHENTIRVVYRSYSDFAKLGPLLTAVKTDFEAANPGVSVQLVPVTAMDNDYQHKVQLMQRSAATAPDVLFEDGFFIDADAAAGYLLPLDGYLGSWPDWHSQFIESTKQLGKAVDGKT